MEDKETVFKSSVSIAKGYGLDGQGSLSGRGKRFFSTPECPGRPALGPIQPPIQWVPGPLSPGIKRPWREADHYLIKHKDNFTFCRFQFLSSLITKTLLKLFKIYGTK
jgi:hypothetical protein